MNVDQLIAAFQSLSDEDQAKVANTFPTVKKEPTETKTNSNIVTMLNNPRISFFSGESGSKGDVSYDQWRLEVQGLQKDETFTDAILLPHIRRSLRGKAGEVITHLEQEMAGAVTIQDVLDKMDQIFGNILPPEYLFTEFCTARQKSGESIAMWACRMEDILSQLQSKHATFIPKLALEKIKQKQFYNGMTSEYVKKKIWYKVDQGVPYSDLLVAARVAEFEAKNETATVQQAVASSAADSSTNKKLDQILESMNAMSKRIDQLEKKQYHPTPSKRRCQMPQSRSDQSFNGTCYKCKQWGHRIKDCPLN